MITDRKTNFVYFSSLLKELDRYSSFWKKLELILTENKVAYGFIENTRDIWCRDYMPIQTEIDNYIQFNYFPDYCLSPKYISKITIPSEVKLSDCINSKKVELNIDGGNVVKSRSSVLLTDKILKDNRSLNKDSIVAKLKKEFNVTNVYLIPQLPYDMTGHADGMVRFLDENNLLVADYSNESKSWRLKMDKALEKTKLNIITFPAELTNEKNEDGDYSARGVYINFAQVDNFMLFPQFDLDMDGFALDCAKRLFPDCKVIPVDCNEIAFDGGGLNCITWNIKIKQTTSFCDFSQKQPSRAEQETFVFKRLEFYLSTSDYRLIAKGFELAWNNATGEIVGDGELKNIVYRFLERCPERNFIPQYYVDRTIDLILAYMESIGQYGFPIGKN